MLIGTCASVRGQVIGNLPVKGRSPKSTSATPAPSRPGNHAATSASILLSWSVSTCGRPDTTTTTQVGIASQTVSMTALSPGCRDSDFSSNWAGEQNPHSGPPTSPNPSEYGVSPTTTTPTSASVIGADASAL